MPCGPVNTIEQVFNHPQTKHRAMVRQVPDRHGQMIDTVASPINLSLTPLQYHSAAPELGQHSEQVMSQQLGYSEEKIAALRKQGTIS